jgi:TonB family protein
MHGSRLDEEQLDLSMTNRYPYGLFLLLSFLLHLTLLLSLRSWNLDKPLIKEKPDEFIQLVDPPAPKKGGELLFGTDNPADLESIPTGKETRLPPIPKGDGPSARPRTGGSGTGGTGAIKPAGPAGREGVLKRGGPLLPPAGTAEPAPAPVPMPPSAPPVAPLESDRTADLTPGSSVQPPAEGADRMPQPSVPFNGGSAEGLQKGGGSGAPFTGGGRGEPGFPSGPGGLPGLPFADSKSLDRLAKVFSDREQAPPKDAVSINTDELKYYSYMLKVKSKIEYIWRYPMAAAERRMEGDLFLNFTIHRDGRVSDIAIISSSGYELLDREAVRALTEASPFAPLPDAWNEDHITITGHFLYSNRANYIR